MGRFFALIFAIAVGVGGSQAPGFTLQYMQNLTGRVDELRPTVEKFDADVARYGYTRARALNECTTADGLLEVLCNSYATTLERFEDLSAHLAALNAAPTLRKPLILAREYKEDIVKSTWKAFEPALPLNLEGAVYGGGGFAGAWLIFSLLFGSLGALTGGRRYRDEYA